MQPRFNRCVHTMSALWGVKQNDGYRTKKYWFKKLKQYGKHRAWNSQSLCKYSIPLNVHRQRGFQNICHSYMCRLFQWSFLLIFLIQICLSNYISWSLSNNPFIIWTREIKQGLFPLRKPKNQWFKITDCQPGVILSPSLSPSPGAI